MDIERILQHKKPANVPFSIKRYLKDEWLDIPYTLKNDINICLDCGLPTMRLVYQQSEVYTMLCMSCGNAHRYHANSCYEAKQIYNHVDADDYKRAQHAVGLDYHNKPTGRNYFTTNGENPFSTLPNNCYSHKGNSYWIMPYGYLKTILDDWLSQNIYTMQDWQALQKKKRDAKNREIPNIPIYKI